MLWIVFFYSAMISIDIVFHLYGATIVLLLLFLTALNDVGQYVFGKLFGRRPLALKISPNKTLEGAIGGIIFTSFVSAILVSILNIHHWVYGAIIGMVIAMAGIAGDLYISALKREVGVKDSGTIITGHGGIMDRMDSLLLSAPSLGLVLMFLHGISL